MSLAHLRFGSNPHTRGSHSQVPTDVITPVKGTSLTQPSPGTCQPPWAQLQPWSPGPSKPCDLPLCLPPLALLLQAERTHHRHTYDACLLAPL